MKIGTMTFHASCNCGSMLQAFALQEAIVDRYDAEYEIIDYSNYEQRSFYSVFDGTPRRSALRNNLLTLCKGVIPFVKTRNQDYEKFKRSFLRLSPESYKSRSELKAISGKYDMYIAGGDQVWNVYCRDTDDSYFLDFVEKGKKKIAYSPSLGGRDINSYSTDLDRHRRLLLEFDGLSVREGNGREWLRELTGKSVPIMADPTVLLTADTWCRKLPLEEIGGRYIFYYSYSYHDKKDNEIIAALSRQLGIPVLVNNGKHWKMYDLKRFGMRLYPESSPIGFLSLMKNAELVVTQSYHGTLLASIFEKPFISINNQVGTDSKDDRAVFLLRQLGLEDRYIPLDGVLADDGYSSIDYCAVGERLAELREGAYEYLDRFIR